MSFELLEPTKAKLVEIEVLSQKNRAADEAPGVKLTLSMTLANHVLSTMDGHLKSWLFERNEGKTPAPLATKRKDNTTGTLEGVEPVSDLPNLTNVGRHLKRFKWYEEVTGCAAEIRFATTVLKLDDCSLGGFIFRPKEGGSVEVKLELEAPNASEQVFAKLARYKSRELEIVVAQHGVADGQQSIDEKREEKKAATKGDIAAHADEVIKIVKDASDKAEGKKPKEDNSPPPQRLTHENVPEEKPAARRGRRVVAGVE